MSLRWRLDGRLLCAAKCEAEDGDCYIDDRLHYELSIERGVIYPDPSEDTTGLWHWRATRGRQVPTLDEDIARRRTAGGHNPEAVKLPAARLTRRQAAMLRNLRCYDDVIPYATRDGNERRTIASLARRGLAVLDVQDATDDRLVHAWATATDRKTKGSTEGTDNA